MIEADVIVVGRGLIGAAAARYLSQAGSDVLAIGPDEPADWKAHRGVFASHYDQGRITRRLSRDGIWSRLATRSIAAYAGLEAASGMTFHVPQGGLYVAPGRRRPDSPDYLGQLETVGRQLEIRYERLDPADLRRDFACFRFSPDCQAIYEPAPAGFINPRELIQAQEIVAGAHGARILRATVWRLRRRSGHFEVDTDREVPARAPRVLVAAGAFSNAHDLLPRALDLRVKTETTIRVEVSPETRDRLARMPALIYELRSPDLSGIYLLPPIRYPDGNWYLKMGCNTFADSWLMDLTAMRHWMIEGDGDRPVAAMVAAFHKLLPGLAGAPVTAHRCLITYTAHGRPYVAAVAPGLYVATGGNGTAAKSSDALGHLAARLVIHDAWQDDELDAGLFEARFS